MPEIGRPACHVGMVAMAEPGATTSGLNPPSSRGPREENEFRYGGQAGLEYPADPAALDDEQWAHYVFFRDNTRGVFAERWSHSAGCRRFVCFTGSDHSHPF